MRLIFLSFFLLTSCYKVQTDIQTHTEEFKKKFSNYDSFAEVEGRKIHYVTRPGTDRNIIVFLHGSPGDWEAWSRYLLDDELASKATLISLDRFGFGESHPHKAELSLQKQAAVLIPIFEKYSGKKIILVGHSYGGPVALKALIDYPDKIKNVVMLAGAFDPGLEQTLWYQYLARFFLLRWLVPYHLEVCNDEIWGLKKELILLSSDIPLIKNPLLIIQGEEDDLVPPGNVIYLKNHLKNTSPEIIMIEKQGHFLPWEQFAQVKKSLLKILEDF